MARQAGFGLFVISQSGFTESVPSAVRSNLYQRIVMRAGSTEEAQAASGRDYDECPATSLIPGECFALTDGTGQQFVRCFGVPPDVVRFPQAMAMALGDKRPLPFLQARGISS